MSRSLFQKNHEAWGLSGSVGSERECHGRAFAVLCPHSYPRVIGVGSSQRHTSVGSCDRAQMVRSVVKQSSEFLPTTRWWRPITFQPLQSGALTNFGPEERRYLEASQAADRRLYLTPIHSV